LAIAAGVAPLYGSAAAPEVAAQPAAANSGNSTSLDFDHDRAYQTPADWTEVSGQWRVLVDRDAPSEPNALGLPGYGLPHVGQTMLWVDSFFTTNYLVAIPKDTTEYTNFSYEASFKAWGGAWGSYAGLVFRYSDPQNYYVLVAAAPKDSLTLYRMSGGRLNPIKEVAVPVDRGRWYAMKVDARGGHFTAYLDGTKMLEADDVSLAKGRIGVWSQNDSKVSFDNIKLTPAPAGS